MTSALLYPLERLAIIEPSKAGAEHLSFNSTVIENLHRRLAQGAVSLYCPQSHFDALGRPSLPFCPLPVVSIVSRHFFRKTAVEAVAILMAFAKVRLQGTKHAIVLSVFPPLLSWLGFVARNFGISATVILHGELEGLLDTSRQHFTSFGYWVKRFFTRGGSRGLRCFVLSEGIYQRLIDIYPNSAAYVNWSNHPVVPASQTSTVRDIAFATVGVATEKKHDELFALMSDVKSKGEVCAHIGMTEEALYKRYKNSIMFFCEPGDHLGQEKFQQALARVRYAVFPYAMSTYRMTVSGAMLDALGAGSHVVCLPNVFAEDMRHAGLPVTIAANLQDLFATTSMELDQLPRWEIFSARVFCESLLRASGVYARTPNIDVQRDSH